MILFLTGLLLALMVLVGGERGFHSGLLLVVNSLLGLMGICLLCYGISPVTVMAVGCAAFLVTSLLLQNGWNTKTLASLLAIGLVLTLIAVVIGVVCGHAHIAGLDEIQTNDIDNSYLTSGVALDMGAVMLVGLVWGELGAMIDISITIASAMQEVWSGHPELSEKELRSAGMQVGKNVLGTTVNTLVFIAFGETVMLCLLYISDGYSFSMLVNSKSFFQQFGGILFSCQSCLLVVPVTCAAFARLTKSKRAAALLERGSRER